ncbi:MAG: AAA family ATPase [Sporichthya sp.]|nr:AAA family ATPase [Sporichthya sp.]
MPTPYAAVRETHTGVVILLGEHAYKTKKPVAFGFCDFSTLALRAEACRREVDLNRRLAPDVYLGVGTMPAAEGLTGAGEPVVLMRRMPAERRLAALVQSGADVEDEIRQVARLVASFHERTPRQDADEHLAEVAAEGSREALQARWTANLDEMERFGGAVLDPTDLTAIGREAEAFLAGREPLLSDRVAEGRIVDGHGDLLADDIFCLPDGPGILDCLEFDDRLRYVDRIDDIACLAMDLERLGAPGLTARLLGWYREYSNDPAPPSLVHHYLAYRAFVRAKVCCLRAEQGDPDAQLREQAHALIGITRRHLGAGAVRLVLVGGLPGTGKTTLAGRIADELGHVLLSSDRIRKEIAGLNPLERAPATYRDGLYTPAHTAAVYAELLGRAELLLGRGESVVLDARWSSATERAAAAKIATRTHSQLTTLCCKVEAGVAAQRMVGRSGPSDADEAVAREMVADADPWPEAACIDTEAGAPEAARRAVDLIHPAGEGRPWFIAPALARPRAGGHRIVQPA